MEEVTHHGSTEWISVLEAVHLLSPALLGDDQAKTTILARLADGALEGRADIALQEADIDALNVDELAWGHFDRKKHPHQHDGVYMNRTAERGILPVVPADFMSTEDEWVIDAQAVSWSVGYFLARRPTRFVGAHYSLGSPDKLTRRAVYGLLFRRQDVEAIGGLPRRTPVDALDAGRKRGPKHKDTWADWVAEIALMVLESKIRPHQSIDGLIDRAASRLAERGIEPPSRSRTYSAAQAVVRAITRAEES